VYPRALKQGVKRRLSRSWYSSITWRATVSVRECQWGYVPVEIGCLHEEKRILPWQNYRNRCRRYRTGALHYW
jgi:hypothetical protein